MFNGSTRATAALLLGGGARCQYEYGFTLNQRGQGWYLFGSRSRSIFIHTYRVQPGLTCCLFFYPVCMKPPLCIQAAKGAEALGLTR